jgi:opacity protein-like surface antigen
MYAGAAIGQARIDTGSFSPPGSTTASADVKMSGAAAFGMLYLPVPVNNPNCGWFTRRNSVTNTSVAAGAGAQFKLGAWALRAEYERFNVASGNPGLASLAATLTF